MTTATITIPFLEGLKAGTGYSYDYKVATHEAEFINGKWLAERINAAAMPNTIIPPAVMSEFDRMDKKIKELTALVESLQNDIARKDERWGKF